MDQLWLQSYVGPTGEMFSSTVTCLHFMTDMNCSFSQRYKNIGVDFPCRPMYSVCIFEVEGDLWKSNTGAL